MRLTDLDPCWFVDQEGREGMGLSFICPHCMTTRLGVDFINPIDGGAPCKPRQWTDSKGKVKSTYYWKRTGDTFDALTLTPSIDASEQGHWHGHIINGEIR